MAKCNILFMLLCVRGFAFKNVKDDAVLIDQNLSIFFNHRTTEVSARIVGGNFAPDGAYPWMVAITHGVIENFQCGGSIITSRHVLTAAHCIVTIPPYNTLSHYHRVRVGTNIWNSGGQVRSIQGFRRHKEYDWFYKRNDIGILITRDRFEMNRHVAAIPINSRYIPGNIPVRVSGYGRLKTGGPLSDHLMELRKTTVGSSRCIKQVKWKSAQLDQLIPVMDAATQICAFSSINQAVCNGDSGSPLVLNTNQQVGIVSWGIPCALGVPDVYVRVSAYIHWILASIERH